MSDRTDEQEVLFPELEKETSGPPASTGRVRGAYGQKRLLLDKVLHNRSMEIMNKLVDMAVLGDPTAMKLCVDRLYPRPKSAGIVVDLPDIASVDDVKTAQLELAARAANGEIPPDEAAALSAIFKDALVSHGLAYVAVGGESKAQPADAREALFDRLKMVLQRREAPTPGEPETIQ